MTKRTIDDRLCDYIKEPSIYEIESKYLKYMKCSSNASNIKYFIDKQIGTYMIRHDLYQHGIVIDIDPTSISDIVYYLRGNSNIRIYEFDKITEMNWYSILFDDNDNIVIFATR